MRPVAPACAPQRWQSALRGAAAPACHCDRHKRSTACATAGGASAAGAARPSSARRQAAMRARTAAAADTGAGSSTSPAWQRGKGQRTRIIAMRRPGPPTHAATAGAAVAGRLASDDGVRGILPDDVLRPAPTPGEASSGFHASVRHASAPHRRHRARHRPGRRHLWGGMRPELRLRLGLHQPRRRPAPAQEPGRPEEMLAPLRVCRSTAGLHVCDTLRGATQPVAIRALLPAIVGRHMAGVGHPTHTHTGHAPGAGTRGTH